MSRTSHARPGGYRRLLGAALVAGLLLPLALIGSASAGSSASPNACLYPLDGFYRDQAVTLTAASTPVADAQHPSTTSVAPGQTVSVAPGTFDIQIPEYLAKYGYALGLLQPGDNTITAKVWIAVKATNTQEQTQTLGPITVSATTTITTDAADDDRYLSSTPFAYASPVLPATTWTATGGAVTFSQADAGAISQPLPIGPNDAARTVTGSAVVKASFGSSASVAFDCQPGAMSDPQYDEGGTGVVPAAAGAFDSEPAVTTTTTTTTPTTPTTTTTAPTTPTTASTTPTTPVTTPADTTPTTPTTTTAAPETTTATTPTTTTTAVSTPAVPATTVAAPTTTATTTPTTTTAPAAARPSPGALRSGTPLRVVAGRTALGVSCSTAPTCRGTVSVRTFSPVRVGNLAGVVRTVTVTAPTRYTVKRGTTRRVGLRLSSTARGLLRTRSSLRVRVTLTPSSGKAVGRTLILRR